jgi:hypothetical protein
MREKRFLLFALWCWYLLAAGRSKVRPLQKLLLLLQNLERGTGFEPATITLEE